MIYLGNLKPVDDSNSIVGFIHYAPFDVRDGLAK